MSTSRLKSLQLVDHASAQGPKADILDYAKGKVGVVPNMYRGMANAPAVLSTYLHGYALFRQESGFTPAEQEVVFLAVSIANGCDYCTAAHSMIADKRSGVPAEVLQAIRSGTEIPDKRLRALFVAATAMVKTQGRPGAEELEGFALAGFSEEQLLYLILAVSVKTLSNFSNHLFEPELDASFSAYKVSR